MTDTDTSPPRKGFSGSQVALFVLVAVLVTLGASFWVFRTYINPSPFEPVKLSVKEQSRLDTKLRRLGVNPHDIRKMNIKGRILVTPKSGEDKTISLKEAKKYTRKSCLPCTDFSAELADISTGGLGLGGWTLTVIRTGKGERLFEDAVQARLLETRPIEEERRAFDLLIALSRKKRGA